jgi:dihydroorotase-like cyclic amidohydrolase
MVPVMLTHANRGRISLERLVKVLSENVAKIFGIFPRKGVLTVGADADIVVVDLHQRRKLKAEEFYTKAKEVALLYDGFEVQGVPVMTIINGVEVMRNGAVVGKPGTGSFVKPN